MESPFSETCAQTRRAHHVHHTVMMPWFCRPHRWIESHMNVVVHVCTSMAFSWSFVLLLCSSPLGDYGRPCVRTCACS